jgi:hypothetical protein
MHRSLLPNFHNPGMPASLTVKYAKPREGRDGEEEGEGKTEKLVRKRERPPTPEPPRYSRRVAADVSEDLKAGGVNFGLALRALRSWLKTGEVSLSHVKEDASRGYSHPEGVGSICSACEDMWSGTHETHTHTHTRIHAFLGLKSSSGHPLPITHTHASGVVNL